MYVYNYIYIVTHINIHIHFYLYTHMNAFPLRHNAPLRPASWLILFVAPHQSMWPAKVRTPPCRFVARE